MVTNPTPTIFIKLNSNIASQNAENASATVIPNISPPKSSAKVGKMMKRLATNAAPVAIKQDALNESTTVFKFLRN